MKIGEPKAIILAAGKGTRLGELGKEIPKCLIEINGKTILESKIETLKKIGLKEEDIFVVIGNEGECWTKENKEKIKKIAKNIVINYKNLETKNTYSLRLVLNKIEKNDLFIIDGDLIIKEDLLKKILTSEKNLVLLKESYNKEDVNNKASLNNDGRLLRFQREKGNLPLPYLTYTGMIKLKKENFDILKDILNQEKYKILDTGFLINELCNKIEIHAIISNEGINVNTLEDLEEARKIFQKREKIEENKKNFIILMSGYTGVGKSTIAKKIAEKLKAKIFHSAVIRKELGLTPSKEDADKFFDYRNNLRQEVDKKVYGKLAEYGEKSLTREENVVLDAGYFFKWQRQNLYEKAVPLDAEIFIVRVTCKDEEEIKKRLRERGEKFEESAINETPSWNTYIATKQLTEPIEEDVLLNKEKPSIIEYDTITKEIRIIYGDKNSENAKKIIESIAEKDNFVIALDFDGVVTSPYKLKTQYINELGYNLSIEQCSRQDCVNKLGVKEEDYNIGSIKAYTEPPEKLPLEKDFLENFTKIRALKGISIFFVTSRFNEMLKHLKDYLDYHNIKVDGVINTENKSKTEVLKKIKASVFVDDSVFKLCQILEEDKEFAKNCSLVLYRNIQNKMQKNPDKERIIEVDNWNDLYEIL
ncbi:MAG TPA: AAA family ATPase, partial [Candidatus Paceibacterota bacterium]|nr:AAA family ATPase [Candidatus Paceibacterota bacterium]